MSVGVFRGWGPKCLLGRSVRGRGHLFYVSLSGLRGGVLLILMSTEVISVGGVINFSCQLECFGRGG